MRTAVVGVGHQGKRHAEKFAAIDRSELVAVLDESPDRAREVGRALEVPVLDDLRDLPGRVDAVAIATPTPSHHAIAKLLLQHDIHVLIEKPFTTTVEEAGELVALADERGLVLQVGHLERFNPAVLAIADTVSHPRFIESLRIASYRPLGLDVSVVLDLMIHDIDLIHSFARSRAVRAEAVGESVFSGSVDIANARITFENGCVANVTSSRISLKTERTIRIFEDKAYHSVDLLNKQAMSCRPAKEGVVESPEDLVVKQSAFDAGDALRVQAEAFLGSVAGGPRPLVDGRAAMQALETALLVTRAIEENAA